MCLVNVEKLKKIRKVKEHNNHALSSHRQEIIATDISIYSVTKLRICMGIFICKTISSYGIDVNAGLAHGVQINFLSVFLHNQYHVQFLPFKWNNNHRI